MHRSLSSAGTEEVVHIVPELLPSDLTIPDLKYDDGTVIPERLGGTTKHEQLRALDVDLEEIQSRATARTQPNHRAG